VTDKQRGNKRTRLVYRTASLGYLQWVVAEREGPLQAQADLDSQDARSACLDEGSGLPIQVAKGTPWEFEAGLDDAACLGEMCQASIAAGGLHMLGSSARRLMDLWERPSQT